MIDAIIEQTNDAIPIDLLLLSDPSEEVIAEYLNSSEALSKVSELTIL